MNKGVYLIWDLPAAQAVDPKLFFAELEGNNPCAVQLRAKDSVSVPTQLHALVEVCGQHEVAFFVNDFEAWVVDGVDGLHLGQNDGPAPARDDLEIGRSTHDLRQVQEAADDPLITCLGFGPVRSTTSKVGALSPRGMQALTQAVERAQGKPVIAIGGLGLGDLEAVHRSGAHAAAVISAVWDQPDPAQALRRLVQRWDQL